MKVLRKGFSHSGLHERSRGRKTVATCGQPLPAQSLRGGKKLGKISEPLGMWGADELDHFGKTATNLIGTEESEDLEEARTDCFTSDRYTDRVN